MNVDEDYGRRKHTSEWGRRTIDLQIINNQNYCYIASKKKITNENPVRHHVAQKQVS